MPRGLERVGIGEFDDIVRHGYYHTER